MRPIRPGFIVFAFSLAVALRGQSLVPVVTQPLPAQALSPGGAAVTIDVRNYITVPGLVGTQFAKFDTVFGRFSVELRNDVAPRHVANFLGYAQRGDYGNSFIHREASFDNTTVSIVQGGGYRLPFPVQAIPRQAAVALEYNLPNARGTLAAARSSNVDSATSEWFFNVRDNSTILNQGNGGGYTVFGRVLGTGMSVVDAMAALPRFNATNGDPTSPFGELPLRNYTTGNPTEANLVVVNSVTSATLFPTGGGTSVIDLSVQNSAPAVVSTVLSGSTLTITPVSSGVANITVRAVDTNNNSAESTFAVSVAATAPVYTAQPISLTAAAGSTVVFNAPATGAATYRWERDGAVIAGATSATLVVNSAGATDAGTYRSFATNSIGSAVSDSATLAIVGTDPVNVGRLVNLSILTNAGAGSKVLTMGAFVGPIEATGGLPLVIRAVGPTLQPLFNVSGVLPDPEMNLFPAGAAVPLETNDNWGGSAIFANAFRAVAAFELPPNSLDAAIVRPAPGVSPGGYTIQVKGKGESNGTVIAEIYDASGDTRTATSPRLINLSTRALIDANTDLAVGFVLGGVTARTVLVRGVGPSLTAFGLTGVMVDPRLELFNNSTGARIASNDDWAGSLDIAAAAASVGAFPLSGGASKDAVLLITLPPGPYSARISGVGGGGGIAIVEVYEVR